MSAGYSCGHFDDSRREYVITDPRTPVKWINYIGDIGFGGFVDQTGGGVLCRRDPSLGRITRFSTQIPNAEFNGETAYIRVREAVGASDKSEVLFSPYWVPTLTPFESFECRVGLGYSLFRTVIQGIECEVFVFVPRGAAVAVRRYRVTNRRAQPVEIDLIPVVEWCHFDALKQLTNADWVPQTMQSEAIREQGDFITLMQCAFMQRGRAMNYLTASVPASSFETERAGFLGDRGYGRWSAPHSLERPELPCKEARQGDNIAALLLRLGELHPGESREVSTLVGQSSSFDDALPVIERLRKSGEVEREIANLRDYWSAYLDRFQAVTPDSQFDSMINVHNPRQCWTTATWSRYLSLYQLGFGSRGIGTRDSAQDAMGIVASDPARAATLIEMLLAIQLRDGSSMHQVNPLSKEASAGDATERDDRPHYYGDDHLWPLLAVCAYLKETGDFDLLSREVDFYDRDHGNLPLERATVEEHIERALLFTWRNRGLHGLPLLGFADWNDTVNLPRGAESLFNANLFGLALREFIALLKFRGRESEIPQFEGWYLEIREAAARHAWDGDWYLRYFDADGTAIGSHASAKGKIFANGQSWPILSGFADKERAIAGLDALRKYLNTPKGIKLSWPGYNGFDPGIGGITTYPPGAKENGGIFVHANPWVVIAEARVGRGDLAYEYYSQINPATRNDRIDEYECEPYVYAQNMLGDEHPRFGLARNSWLTGAASWMYQAATQYLLGVRPDYDSLIVDPCIPSKWERCRVSRVFRETLYEITIRNPAGVNRGVASLVVDGKPLGAAFRVPHAPGRIRCSVEATLGPGGATESSY